MTIQHYIEQEKIYNPDPKKEMRKLINPTKVLASSPPFTLIKYANSNYICDSKDKKIVIDNCFFIYKAIVSWYSKN